MADILPKPSDNPIVPSPTPARTARSRIFNSQNRLTIAALVSLIIIAVLAIAAGYVYDVINNHTNNNTRRQDISYIASNLNDYYNLNHFYPTLTQLNSSTFSAFAPSLNLSKFKDPSSNSEKLAAAPQANVYAYQALPTGCNNTSVMCLGYKLTATLSTGTDYTVSKSSAAH